MYVSTQSTFSASSAAAEDRATFIRKTYLHLAAAIGLMVLLESVLLKLPGVENWIAAMTHGQYSWLIVLGLFMGATWIGERMARSGTSQALQYLGLALFVVAYAIVFLPILYIAQHSFPGVIAQAGITCGFLFAGLTATVFITRKDFSFLGPIIAIASLIALGVIIAGILFGFNLGLFFSAAMVALAAGAILYHTSNVLHTYSTSEYVAAALTLFGSVALLFFYILRILMSRR